jgi:glycosyltransferase involved in cell wall biosynthesis
MRLLFTVEFYDPSTGGAQEVVKQIAERLVRRGHEITVATSFLPSRKSQLINGVRIRQFGVAGNAGRGITGEADLYKSFLKTYECDVLFNYAALIWTTDLTFDVIGDIRARKVLAPLGYSKFGNRRYQEYFRSLPESLAKYDKLVYTSPDYQDKEFGDHHGLSDKAIIISNGASEVEFSHPPIGFRERYGVKTRFMVICVSNHYIAKGHRFVVEAFQKMKRGDTTLVVIGERPQAHPWYSCYPFCRGISLMNNRVKALSGVPREWVISAYQEADLFFFGSKVETAPLVMYESFASKTAFISTPAGNVRDHIDVVKVVASPKEMAAAANRLLDDEDERSCITEDAHRLWKSNHTWEHITGKYEELFSSLIKS